MKKTFVLAVALAVAFGAAAQNIFFENFDTLPMSGSVGTTMPTGWTTYADNYTNHDPYNVFNKSWSIYSILGAGYGKSAISASYISENANVDRWLITPQINVDDAGYNLTFLVAKTSNNEHLIVLGSSDSTEKADFTDTLADIIPANGLNTHLVNLDRYEGQSVYIAFVNRGRSGAVVLDNVSIDRTPDNSLAFHTIKGTRYVQTGDSASIFTTVVNTGSDTLRSYDIEYSVNGTATVKHIAGVAVLPYEYHTDTLQLDSQTPSRYDVSVMLRNPNGEQDPDSTDNSGAIAVAVYDLNATTSRNATLLEHYTTAQCNNCPAGHESLRQSTATIEDKVVWVSHHVGFGTDDMTLSASNEPADAFGVSGAPMITIDRNIDFSVGEGQSTPTVAGFIANASHDRNRLQTAAAQPAFVSLTLDSVAYDTASRELSVELSGALAIDLAEAPRLSVWITEDSIIGRQMTPSGIVSDYRHDHVLRGLVTGIWGTAEPFDTLGAGGVYAATYTYTLPAGWRAERCRVVAFVADNGPAVTERTVLNAVKSDYLCEAPATSGIAAVATAKATAHPNPATTTVRLTAGSTILGYTLVNSVGQTVAQSDAMAVDFVDLDVSELPAGLYIATLRTAAGTTSCKTMKK